MNCPECGVEEGQLHVPGCAVEECPACGGQLIECNCFTYGVASVLGLGSDTFPRQPWINFPRVCARCGKVNPEIFMVPDNEWEDYVPVSIQDQHLCRECYDEIKRLIDKGQK